MDTTTRQAEPVDNANIPHKETPWTKGVFSTKMTCCEPAPVRNAKSGQRLKTPSSCHYFYNDSGILTAIHHPIHHLQPNSVYWRYDAIQCHAKTGGCVHNLGSEILPANGRTPANGHAGALSAPANLPIRSAQRRLALPGVTGSTEMASSCT